MVSKQDKLSSFSFDARKFFRYIHENGKAVLDEGFYIEIMADSFSVATTLMLAGQGIYVYGEDIMNGKAFHSWIGDEEDDIVSLSENETIDVFYYQNPKDPSDVYFVRRESEGFNDRSYHKTSVKMLEFLKKHG